jgi:hypothetical protein
MLETNKTKRIGMNISYVWIQEILPNRFCNINQQDTEALAELEDFGQKTSEMEQAGVACPEIDVDEML